jgi:hypothetical protein
LPSNESDGIDLKEERNSAPLVRCFWVKDMCDSPEYGERLEALRVLSQEITEIGGWFVGG